MLSIKCRKCRNPLAFETWERGELIDLMVTTDHLCDGDISETKKPHDIITCPICASERIKLTLKRPNGDMVFNCQACHIDWTAKQ